MVSFPEELLEILSTDETAIKLWMDCNNAVEASFNSPQQQSLPSTVEATLSAVGDKLEALLSREQQAPLLLEEWLRATKNVLRWNLTFCEPNACFATTLQSKKLLKVYTNFLSSTSDQVTRYATLSLFHATFSASPPKLPQYVVQDLKYLDTFATRILTTTTNQSVLLASLRLVHNLIVTYPKTASILMKTNQVAVTTEGDSASVPWLQSSPPPSSIYDLMICLLEYCLLDPTENPDRRVELRTELLRIFYALQAGKVMSPTLLHQLLHFDDPDVRLSAVTLLMDAPVLEFNGASSAVLFEVFQQQVTLVVEQTLVGSAAASAMTPILIVLRKYCMNDAIWKEATKDFIFPNPIAVPSAVTPNTTQQKNKLSPTDAPRGTLRWKCIQLLTWTQGHVKRCMAELLWVLCDENPDEYMNRVGLGNAMPLLQAKGYMEQQQQGRGAMDLNSMMS